MDKFFDNAFTHLLILALAVGGVFLLAKGAATALPENGFAGSIKHVIKSV